MDAKLKELNFESRSPLTEHQLQQIEALIRCSLPPAYRRLLSKYGGVSFPDAFYREPTSPIPIRFGWFCDAIELIDCITSYSDMIPQSMIAVGEDDFGNLYCLGVRGTDRDRLFFRIHDIGWSGREAGDSPAGTIDELAIYQISATFEGFIESLFIYDE